MIQKTVFRKIKTDPPQYLRILQIGHRIYHARINRTIAHAEHILNEEFQSSQLIVFRQHTSLGYLDFNIDLEPGSPPSPASSTRPVSPPTGYPQSPNSQQLPVSPQSTDSLQSVDSPQPPVLQLSSLPSSPSEPPNEVFNMEPLAAIACRNQKNLSSNQPVNFKYLKRENTNTKTAIDHFNLSGINGWLAAL